jgi:hypothetical protein
MGMTLRRSIPLLAAIMLSACGRITDSDKKAAVECVKANLAAMDKGDMKALVDTIHPESPDYLQMPDLARKILTTYKLKFTLEEVEVERVTKEAVHVRFVQVTKRIAGPEDFPDNRMEGMHVVRRDGNRWKIWYTQRRQLRTLDGQPMPAGVMPAATAEADAPAAIPVATPIPGSGTTSTVPAPKAIPVAATPSPPSPGQ